MIRSFVMLVAVLSGVSYGCSLLQGPDDARDTGAVSFFFVRSGASLQVEPGLDGLSAAAAVTDSVVVGVFPPGNGGTQKKKLK